MDTVNEISAAIREGDLRGWLSELTKVSPTLALISSAMGYLSPLLPLFKQLGERVGPVLADAFKEIAKAVLPLVPVLSRDLANAIIQITPPLADLLVALLPIIPPLLQLVQLVLPALTFLISTLAPIVATSASEWRNLFDVISEMLGFISGNTSFPEFVTQIQGFQGTIGGVIATVLNFQLYMSTVMRDVVSTWRAGWSEVQGFFSQTIANVMSFAASFWMSLPAGFRNGVAETIGVLQALPANIMRIFSGIGAWLFGSGQALMRGFIDGINSMIRNVGSAINSVLEWAAGFFPHSPAKRGTFAGSGWTSVYEGGEALIEQFAFGVESFKPEISFANMSGLIGASTQTTVSALPAEAVIRDVNDELVGRMRLEANVSGASRGEAVARSVRNRKWGDA